MHHNQHLHMCSFNSQKLKIESLFKILLCIEIRRIQSQQVWSVLDRIWENLWWPKMPSTNGSCGNLSNMHQSGFEVAIELYVISIIGTLGLLGNIVSIIVLRQDKERRQTLLLLQIMALSDGLYLVAALVRYPLKYMIEEAPYQHIQLYGYPLLKMFQTITIWMMVLVTVDRFIYVCKPLHAQDMFRQKTRRTFAVLVFVFGTIYSLPRFFESCLMTYDICDNKTKTIVIIRKEFHNVYYYNIYRYAMHILFLYMGPLVTLCVMNIQLIITIRKSRQLHREMRRPSFSSSSSYRTNALTYRTTSARHYPPSHAYNSQTENNATLVLIIIIIVFILCETPESLLRIVIALDQHIEYIDAISPAFYRCNTMSVLLMVINCSINFLIYLLFGRRFRHILKETFIDKFQMPSTLTRETLPLRQQNIYA